MILKMRIKAGLMLYALLMLSLFSLLLQFYLNRQVTMAQTNQASKESLTAYAMATWTKEKLETGLIEKEKAPSEESSNETEGQATEAKEGDKARVETAESPSVEEAGESQSKKKDAEKIRQPREELEQQGRLNFDKGQTTYTRKGNQLTVSVSLATGHDFQYRFHINSKNK